MSMNLFDTWRLKEMDISDDISRSLEQIAYLLKSIDFQLTKLVKVLSITEQDEGKSKAAGTLVPRLLTTKEASQMFGLSEYELRRGYKMGIYPAIEVGGGEKVRRLRWRSDLLEKTLKKGTD